MRVRELMTSPAHACSPQDTLEQAARLLWEKDCGILPVVDRNGRVGGAITDRDICMCAYTKGGRLADLRVSDSMSGNVVTCAPGDEVAAAARSMAEHQVRRLPVVDAEGRIAGILSLNDLARAAAGDAKTGKEALKVLTAVCQPRAAPAAGAEAAARTRSKAKASKATRTGSRGMGGREARS